jgi:dipeptidyl-peptidase-4
MEDLPVTDNGSSVLKMTETDGWRHLYNIDLNTGMKTLLTPGDYDVARYYAITEKFVYFSASPQNSTQRYLYRVPLTGKGDTLRITPREVSGMNRYNVSTNGKFAVYRHSSINDIPSSSLVNLPSHKTIRVFTDNAAYKKKMEKLRWPVTEFFSVTTADGVEMDGLMTLPVGFDPQKKYPVFFYVYGEPWEQVATDSWLDLWNIMLAQQGYLVMAMDNRGSPCLKAATGESAYTERQGPLMRWTRPWLLNC